MALEVGLLELEPAAKCAGCMPLSTQASAPDTPVSSEDEDCTVNITETVVNDQHKKWKDQLFKTLHVSNDATRSVLLPLIALTPEETLATIMHLSPEQVNKCEKQARDLVLGLRERVLERKRKLSLGEPPPRRYKASP